MNITLMAHDKKKELMVQFCTAYKSILSKDNLVRLREVYPEIYEQFVETSESRRFSIKIAVQPAA